MKGTTIYKRVTDIDTKSLIVEPYVSSLYLLFFIILEVKSLNTFFWWSSHNQYNFFFLIQPLNCEQNNNDENYYCAAEIIIMMMMMMIKWRWNLAGSVHFLNDRARNANNVVVVVVVILAVIVIAFVPTFCRHGCAEHKYRWPVCFTLKMCIKKRTKNNSNSN